MTAYADSSALAKRYLEESGSARVRSATALIASTLSVVEVSSAIWRRAHMQEITAADAALLVSEARSELTGGDLSVILIPPTTSILLRATQLTGTAGLRAYDAVQLSTAIEARGVYPGCLDFVCFDQGLSTAAASHGFTLVQD